MPLTPTPRTGRFIHENARIWLSETLKGIGEHTAWIVHTRTNEARTYARDFAEAIEWAGWTVKRIGAETAGGAAGVKISIGEGVTHEGRGKIIAVLDQMDIDYELETGATALPPEVALRVSIGPDPYTN